MAHHHHPASEDHSHGHHVHGSGAPEGRLALSLALNLVITAAEVVGGLASNSLALLSDAVHNLSDASSLGISWMAARIARRERTPAHSFGFRRAEVLASLMNTVALMGVGLFLMVEGVRKFLHPEPIAGGIMLAVACVGLGGNLLTAWLLHRDAKGSLNVRSAYLHVVMDSLSSLGVIAAALLVMAFRWTWLDPLLTLAVSLYVLWECVPLLRQSLHILMQGTPEGVAVEELMARGQAHRDVRDLHHLHLWTTDGTEVFLEAHVTLKEQARDRTDRVLEELSRILREDFAIAHVTLQLEFSRCAGDRCSGMDAPHPGRGGRPLPGCDGEDPAHREERG